MELTLTHTDIFENLETGAVEERFRFAGAGATFDAAGKPVTLPDFDLRVMRDEDLNVDAVLLEVAGLDAATWQAMAQAVSLPPLPAGKTGRVLLQLKADILAQDVIMQLFKARELPQFLALKDGQGLSVFFRLTNYDCVDGAAES